MQSAIKIAIGCVKTVIEREKCMLICIHFKNAHPSLTMPPTIESHRGRDDLRCQYSPDPKEEIAAHLAGYGTINSGKL